GRTAPGGSLGGRKPGARPGGRRASRGGDERWGVWGAISGPPTLEWTNRDARTEERPGFAGTRRTLGGLGGHFGAPQPNVESRREDRGASRLRRDATNAGGFGGPFRGPPT